jgi:thiol:disulfide interchange protein
MKRTLATAGLALWMILQGIAQIADPVKWTFSHERTGEMEAELIFRATIDRPWHLYSAYLPEGGPIATKATFDESEAYSLVGGIIEVTRPEKKYDEGFRMELGTISGRAELRQKVRFYSQGTHTITGGIEFQVCNDVTCLPPRYVEFAFTVAAGETGEAGSAGGAAAVRSGPEVAEEPVPSLSGLIKQGLQAGPDGSPDTALGETPQESMAAIAGVPAMEGERSLWGFFWLAFGLGLLALLTPCVFPMIPMTVSFFMQGGGSRAGGFFRGLIFGLSIVAIYTSLGVIVSISNVGPSAANALSTHWIPNLIFFALFVIFAFSFFGMFELVLPSSWVNKTDSRADKGGLGGAFFMALTTVLVSFSCTGPIVGALLVEAAGGLALKPILGMFGFALAFAIPFTLFAIFPSWLKGLPNRILTRELYLAVWIVLFFLLGLYFLGKIKFAHDSDLSHVTVPRLLLSVATFTFVIYLFLGLFGYELKNIAPLLPPKSPNGLDLTQKSGFGALPSSVVAEQEECMPQKYADLFHMPLGLNGFFDLEEGLACARATGKPVLIDFKGHFCSNCKKMEAAVWSDPEVLTTLKKEFVIVALYTDDRTKLPEEEWYTSKVDGKEKKTIGQQNIDFEIARFQTNTIPLYVIMDAEGNPVGQPRGTDLNVQSYLGWLKEGARAVR